MHYFLILILFPCIDSIFAQQFYDSTPCSSDSYFPGTRYTCNSSSGNKNSCRSFLIYRANPQFHTISTISTLFSLTPQDLLKLNNLTSSSPNQPLINGREIIIPITCSCSGQFFYSNFSYTVPAGGTTFPEIACGVFEGLTKSITLIDSNPYRKTNLVPNSELRVPLKCACPDNVSGVKYLVTYPFVEKDDTIKLATKFGIPPEEIWRANGLGPFPTVYPNTTVLVPLQSEPKIDFNFPDIEPPIPSFLPTKTVHKTKKNRVLNKLYVVGSVIGFSLLLITLLACGLYVREVKKLRAEKNRGISLSACSTPRSSQISGLNTRNSTNSCLSPDLLVGIKYSLCNFSVEEIRRSTDNFNAKKISEFVYRGVIDRSEVMIKRMKFEDTRPVIDLHSKINHVNIVKLLGVCYGDSNFSSSYLVFEFPVNGCLRDLLSNPTSGLMWNRRTQIAFDVATGLHYLHYCMVPRYTHLGITSRNIFLTQNWRAKLEISGSNPNADFSQDCDNWGDSISGSGSWFGSVSEKVDILAYGVVLLEIISGREDLDGESLRKSIGFLGGEGGCFGQLRNFVDPWLKDNYPLAEALCLAVLAKACVEDDPMHRPCMDDIIKVLARMV